MIVHKIPQYSEIWWQVRAGVPTASNFDKIMTPGRRQKSSQQDAYINDLIAERLTPSYDFVSQHQNNRPHTAAMEHGNRTEQEARHFYAMMTGNNVSEVGFCQTDDEQLGCSPDGLIVNEEYEFVGGLELKCPILSTHVGYLRDGKVPTQYLCQVHGQLIVTGLPWVDFMSYAYPLDPLLVRVYWDDFTDDLSVMLREFCDKYKQEVDKIMEVCAI